MSNTTKLIFYRAETGNMFDKIVSFFDEGPYSHVEIVLEENETSWTTVGSSNRDGGVRVRTIPKSDHWDTIVINKTPIADYHEYIGAKYDWIGLGHTIWNWWPTTRFKYVCSTFAAELFGIDYPKEEGVHDFFLWAKSREIKLLIE